MLIMLQANCTHPIGHLEPCGHHVINRLMAYYQNGQNIVMIAQLVLVNGHIKVILIPHVKIQLPTSNFNIMNAHHCPARSRSILRFASHFVPSQASPFEQCEVSLGSRDDEFVGNVLEIEMVYSLRA